MVTPAELEAMIRRVVREEVERALAPKPRRAPAPEPVVVTPEVQSLARRALEARGLLGHPRRR